MVSVKQVKLLLPIALVMSSLLISATAFSDEALNDNTLEIQTERLADKNQVDSNKGTVAGAENLFNPVDMKNIDTFEKKQANNMKKQATTFFTTEQTKSTTPLPTTDKLNLTQSANAQQLTKSSSKSQKSLFGWVTTGLAVIVGVLGSFIVVKND